MIKARRKESNSVTQKMIKKEARTMFSRLYPNEATFLASDGWLRKFLKRNKIIFRHAPELAETFLDTMLALPEF